MALGLQSSNNRGKLKLAGLRTALWSPIECSVLSRVKAESMQRIPTAPAMAAEGAGNKLGGPTSLKLVSTRRLQNMHASW